MRKVVPIILAGGSGSRLWPLSREHYPKQLLSLVGEHSLLQETIKRSVHITDVQPPIVICNKEYRFLIAEQMLATGIKEPKLILENTGRNTAPAIAMAAHIVNKIYPEESPLLLILPADHLLQAPELFAKYLNQTNSLDGQDYLITFGITPTYPETGYGYIKAAEPVNQDLYKVAQFTEKPSLEKAQEYLASNSYYWNSGMFLFKSTTYLNELKKYRPAIADACASEAQAIVNMNNFFHLSEHFNHCPAESIDYAIMEHTDRALMMPLPLKWSDVGSWSALLDILPKDNQGNIIQGDVTAIDMQNCYVRSEDRLIAIAGLQDHIVVETSDAVMIAHKDYAQKVKDLFNNLKAKSRNEVIQHSLIQRPWGSYKTLTEGSFYRVKHVIVKPGASLSSQAHQHRSEHWIVLKGVAHITVANKQKTLNTYESTFIPVNHMHQLSNPGKESLEIIEVQAGDYLSEADIYHDDD